MHVQQLREQNDTAPVENDMVSNKIQHRINYGITQQLLLWLSVQEEGKPIQETH